MASTASKVTDTCCYCCFHKDCSGLNCRRDCSKDLVISEIRATIAFHMGCSCSAIVGTGCCCYRRGSSAATHTGIVSTVTTMMAVDGCKVTDTCFVTEMMKSRMVTVDWTVASTVSRATNTCCYYCCFHRDCSGLD